MLARQDRQAGSSLPALTKAPLPLEQLLQLQRRMAHLLQSLNDFHQHVATAMTLDEWPALVNRHLTLVAQTHSLAQILSVANPNALNVKLAKHREALKEEAHQMNKFDSDGRTVGVGGNAVVSSNDALFAGSTIVPPSATQNTSGLPRIRYSDGFDNPIARIDPHPFLPIDADKSQSVIPSLLLPRGIDEKVRQDAQEYWQTWIEANDKDDAATIDLKRSWIPVIREQIASHDAFAQEAIRSFTHAREATDDVGQRYDWKLRLTEDSDDDDNGGDEDDAMQVEDV